MILRIKYIILYPVNKDLSPRIIPFDENKVNVITGYSKRGKSSIIEIIDYCLGNSEPNIPIGKIRNLVDKFALKLNINGTDVFLARDSPGKTANSSDQMYYVEIERRGEYKQFNTNEWIYDSDKYKYSREVVKQILSRKAGFKNLEDASWNADHPLTVGFRDTSAFQFQPQNIIANGNTIFYKTDTYSHVERLRTLFPLALGYKSYDILLLEDEIRDLESEEKKLSQKIEDLEERYENWKSDIYEYYSEAIGLGLTDEDLDINQSGVDSIKEELFSVIHNVRKNQLFKLGSSLRFSEKLEDLEAERVTLTRQLQIQRMELNKILKFENGKDEYFKSVTTEIDDRLKPIDWFLQKKGTNICPFCDSKSDKALLQLQRLKDIKINNTGIIGSKESEIFSFEGEKRDLKKSIKEQEDKIVEFDKNIEIIYREQNENQLSYQRIYEFVGKVENFLKNIVSPDHELVVKLSAIQAKLSEKRSKLGKLRKKFDKEVTLGKLTKTIKTYVDMLPIEDRQFCNVLIDPDKYLGIKIENSRDNSKTFLNKIGSGSNYMCYHLATLLGLHEFFYKLAEQNKANYVPSFLILDQPSQVYYPEREKFTASDEKIKRKSEDIKNTEKIFEVCSKFMERTNHEIQIIILEHASADSWDGLKNVDLVEDWRGEEEGGIYTSDYKALLMPEWLIEN